MTPAASADTEISGSIRAADGAGIVRLTARVDAPPADVWSALTDPDRLGQWLGEVTGDLRVGGEYHAHYYASGWDGVCQVAACEAGRRLRIISRSPGERDGVIEVSLTADGDRAILVIEDPGLPLDQIAAYAAGNQIHLEDLVAHLGGRGRCDPSVRFEQLCSGYQEMAEAL